MGIVPVDLGLTTNEGRDAAISPTRLINCYADDLGTAAKVRHPILACDGFEAWSTSQSGSDPTNYANGVNRGLFAGGSFLYVASGNGLFRVNSAGAWSNCSGMSLNLPNSLSHAYFAEYTGATRRFICVWAVPPDNSSTSTAAVAYHGTSDQLVEAVTAVSLPQTASQLSSVCEIDNYFVLSYITGAFYISGLGLTTFDPLDTANAGFQITRAARRGKDLVLAGPAGMSFWQNTGASDFPFERVTETNIGLLNAPALVPMVAYADGQAIETLVFPATGLNKEYAGVRLLVGYDSRKISNEEVDEAILAEPNPRNIRACTYSRHGTNFYHIQGATFSYEFNTKTGFWHERQGSGSSIAPFSNAVDFANRTIFTPQAGGKTLWRSSGSLTPSSATNCTLRTSRDNGSTWTSTRSKTIGGSSARKTRVRFNRLGQSTEDGLQLEIKLTNAIVEASNLADATIIPPAVHSWPSRVTYHALHVDTIPGVSQTSGPKGVLQIALDVGEDLA